MKKICCPHCGGSITREISAAFKARSARGGAAGKGSPERIAINRRAIAARWERVRAAKALASEVQP
jgi:hypothetical protein